MEENHYRAPKGRYVNEEGEQEIDLMELLAKLWIKRKLLLKVAGISFVAGCVIALCMSRSYTAKVTLSPEMEDSGKSSSSLSSLAASFLGSSAMTGSTTDAINIVFAGEIVSSVPFLLDLSEVRVQTLDGKVDTTYAAYLEEGKGNVIGVVLHAPGLLKKAIKSIFVKETEIEGNIAEGNGPIILTEEQDEMVESMREMVSASVDNTTAITTIAVKAKDPKVSAILANAAAEKLQERIVNYRVAKAQEDADYYEMLCNERQAEYYEAQAKYADYVDANRNIALQSVRIEQERLQNDMSLAYQIYVQVSQQLQMARAKVQEVKPVFAVLEPAVVPRQPSGMGRTSTVIVIVFLAVCCAAAWIVFRSLFDGSSFKDKVKELESSSE